MTREELERRIHPNCACLHLMNPALYGTLHPGGAEALIARRELKTDAERTAEWKAQKAVVDRESERQKPGMVYILESTENSVSFDFTDARAETFRVCVTIDEGRPCV